MYASSAVLANPGTDLPVHSTCKEVSHTSGQASKSESLVKAIEALADFLAKRAAPSENFNPDYGS